MKTALVQLPACTPDLACFGACCSAMQLTWRWASASEADVEALCGLLSLATGSGLGAHPMLRRPFAASWVLCCTAKGWGARHEFTSLTSAALARLFRPLPAWEYRDYLGWMEQGDGRLAYGVHVQNGRLAGGLKQALRTVIERYELPVLLTANQNLILTEIEPSWKADVLNTLQAGGVRCALLFWLAAPPLPHSACLCMPRRRSMLGGLYWRSLVLRTCGG